MTKFASLCVALILFASPAIADDGRPIVPLVIFRGAVGLVADPAFRPTLGDRAVLAVFNPDGSPSAALCTPTPQAWVDGMKPAFGGDTARAVERLKSEGLLVPAHGTPVVIVSFKTIRRGDGPLDVAQLVEVRVLDGDHKGETLWTNRGSLARLVLPRQAAANAPRDMSTTLLVPGYVPKSGDSAILAFPAPVAAGDTLDASADVWASTSVDAHLRYDACVKAARANRAEEVSLLMDRGDVVNIPAGTPIQVGRKSPTGPPNGSDAVEVKVAAGQFRGKTFLVHLFLIQKVRPGAVATPAAVDASDKATAERAREIQRRKARRSEKAAFVAPELPPMYFTPTTSGAVVSGFKPMYGMPGYRNPFPSAMTTPSFACGAWTLQNRPCLNMVVGGGYCYLHR